ncbi:MAG: D-alanine--poly(phosphoribitol) ligase [Phycisphaerae bacterium]
MTLHSYLIASARRRPEHPAVLESDGRIIRYDQIDRLSDRVRDRLIKQGVRSGDRVGIYMHKSADAVACLFGILKAGAAYVPVDPGAPASRNGYIHADCGVRVSFVENCFEAAYAIELERLGASPARIVLDGTGGGEPLARALDSLDSADAAPESATVASRADDLAYILYTSGSTGKPKGVMLSHRNATAFVDWCTETFLPRPEDRFSSHAPFHFDLSILDIYVPVKHGGTLVLVPEHIGKEPVGLSRLISEQRISVWYSAPSILSLLAQSGQLPRNDYTDLRIVLFAGEVFPVVNLRLLKKQWPHPRYFNLYGPTETNVCTWYEIPADVPEDRVDPYPIGRTCPRLSSRVVDLEGRDVSRGSEGELCIAGPHVMQGYWNQPELTAKAFLVGEAGERWYRTGDLVVEETDGNYLYRGRRDRMIKKRGYRVELGEIEACLYRHPKVREAAVLAVPDEQLGMKVVAHLAGRDQVRLSIIDLKRFCSEHLPVYMVPDLFQFHEALPKTSTDKTDYQKLKAMS